jgi:hypothetical protein
MRFVNRFLIAGAPGKRKLPANGTREELRDSRPELIDFLVYCWMNEEIPHTLKQEGR